MVVHDERAAVQRSNVSKAIDVALLGSPLWVCGLAAVVDALYFPVLRDMQNGVLKAMAILAILGIGTFAGLIPIVRAKGMTWLAKLFVSALYVPFAFALAFVAVGGL